MCRQTMERFLLIVQYWSVVILQQEVVATIATSPTDQITFSNPNASYLIAAHLELNSENFV